MANDKYENAREQQMDVREAEALSRRDESVANVLRGNINEDEKATQQAAKEAAKEARKSAKELEKAQNADVAVDPEGTAARLADSEGNIATDVETATQGGTGVDASNTDPHPAPELSEDAAKVVENRLKGDDGKRGRK